MNSTGAKPGIPAQDTPNALAKSRFNVLVVEDDEAQAGAVTAALKTGGYQTQLVTSVVEGATCLEADRFGCALVDLGLPDGSGIDLIETIRRSDPNLVAVVLTGDHEADTVIHAMRAGAFDYLTKPVDVDTLLASVGRAIAHHSVLAERAELFRLLYEEREQLRSRVDAATADIRQYAAVCEQSNARLRSLLRMRQLAADEYSADKMLRCVYQEMAAHVPLRGIAIADAWRCAAYILYCPDQTPGSQSGAGPVFFQCDVPTKHRQIEWTTDVAGLLRSCLNDYAGPAEQDLPFLVFPKEQGAPLDCAPAFILEDRFAPDPALREFLEMCAYVLHAEWERNRLLSQIAHQASLGSISLELSRSTIQPLTAIRTAADYLEEAISDGDAAEGLAVIRKNVDRLRDQAQEFRSLATHREDSVQTVHIEDYLDQALDMLEVAVRNRNVTITKNARTHGECTLVNGAALARTILDVILGALRMADPGGAIEVSLHKPDEGHVTLELRHDTPKRGVFADSLDEASPTAPETPLGLRLAERTVYACGGVLSVDRTQPEYPVLRIQLPTNTARLAHAGLAE